MSRPSNVSSKRGNTKTRVSSKPPRTPDTNPSHSDRQSALAAWLAIHRSVALDSLRRLRLAWIPSLMTWLVLGIALSLPAGLYVSLKNLAQFGGQWEDSAQISLFLKKNLEKNAGIKLAEQLRKRSELDEVQYLDPEQALLEFQKLSGLNDVLDGLPRNPLPAVILVKPKSDTKAAVIAALFTELQTLPEVDQVTLDQEWLQRLQSLMMIGGRLTTGLALLLSVGVLLVIGNTIRLAIEGRRDEILVMKLVGATNTFVQRPFLYAGFWYGLGGGLFAWLIIVAGLYWLKEPVQALAGLYQSEFPLVGLSTMETVALWSLGAWLGLLGAWLAVAHHVRDIEPR